MQNAPPEKWQLELLLNMVDDLPIESVDWLISDRAGGVGFDWWTATYDRTKNLIEQLLTDIEKGYQD